MSELYQQWMDGPRRKPKPGITEAEFLQQVLEFAKLHGWRSAHFRPAQTDKGWRTAVQGDGKGFPDLLLIRTRPSTGMSTRIVVAELKCGKNKCTDEQTAWLLAFELAGVPAYTWYPSDWKEIEEVLG